MQDPIQANKQNLENALKKAFKAQYHLQHQEFDLRNNPIYKVQIKSEGLESTYYLKIKENEFRIYSDFSGYDSMNSPITLEDFINKIQLDIVHRKLEAKKKQEAEKQLRELEAKNLQELDKIRQDKIQSTNWKSAGITLEKKLDRAKTEIGKPQTKPGTFKIVNPEPGKLFIVAKAEVDGGPKTEVRVYQATVDEDGIRVYRDKTGQATKSYSNFPSPKELNAQLKKHLTPKILSLKDVTQHEIKQKKEIFLLSLDFDHTLVHGHLHTYLLGKKIPYGYPVDKNILEQYYQKYGFKQEGLVVDKMLEVLQQNKKGDKEMYVLINSTSRYPGAINFFVDKLKDKILEKGKNQGITREMVDKLFLYKAPDLFTEPQESPEETLVKDNKGQITKSTEKDGYRGKSNPIFETMIEIGASKPGNVLHMDDDADVTALLKAEIPAVKTVKAPETVWDDTHPDQGRIPIEPDPKYLAVDFTNNFNAMLRGESVKDQDSYLAILTKDPHYSPSPSKPQNQLGAYTIEQPARQEDGSYRAQFTLFEGTVTQYSFMQGAELQKENKFSAGYIVIDNQGFHYRDGGVRKILNETTKNTFDNIQDLMKFAWVDLEKQRVAERNEERGRRGQPLVQDTPREIPKALAEASQAKPAVSPTPLSAAPPSLTPMLDLHKAKAPPEDPFKDRLNVPPAPAPGTATIKTLKPKK